VFFGVLAGLVVVYIVLADTAKTWFFRAAAARSAPRPARPPHEHRRMWRMLARWRHPHQAMGALR
jgi:hypothetical protein